MATSPAHAKPRDHLWVLVVIAACCLIKVWPSWIGIGAEAGFPVIGGSRGMPTDWTLAVVIEAYWGYAVWAALVPAGRRSRRFAAWSAAGVFALSLTGQSAAQVMTATAVKVFANALPVIVLALIAVLIHMRHLDRAEAQEAGERTAVQREVDALRDERDGAVSELGTVRADLAAALGRIGKLEAAGTRRTPRKQTRKPAPQKTPRSDPAGGPATEVPNDVDAQAEALAILAAEPGISGAKLAERVGMSERWGQTFKKNLAARTAGPDGEG